ncbi:PD-(D/E)XK nuclease family protein [Psychrilyobacter atlanticus]|uniref:PD-(D/E)XK nuclease family protein n=1 Tax=Psychrilyobacter atlanticus TaxID=271091 RepID=UPI0004035587|nr:PD-(D/E)XK nuclease family protein [Psychrilyobacter atlanticus]
MNIEYCSYTEEIIENIESGKVHIFPKSVDKSLAKERYMENLEKNKNGKGPNIFLKQPKFMGLGEFKTNLFLSDEMVLREEKQVIAFYRSLSEKNRKELGVESYYDVIDIAANFLNFFKLLKEYRLTEIKDLRKWQRKIYDTFLDIEKNYIKFLSDKNYTDPTFIIKDENYNPKSLDGYRDIIIYNKIHFTPLEEWIVKKLEADGFTITLKLQMNKEDFCEETLSIKDVNIGEEVSKITKKIEVYTVDDEFTELLKVLDVQKKIRDTDDKNRGVKIFDANNDNYKYNSFFNETRYISDLPIFSLLEGLHKLLSTLEEIDGELALELHTVVDIIKGDEIFKYYKIESEDFDNFKVLVNEGYKYLTKYVIAERLGEENFIYRIFEDIEQMRTYENLKKWTEKLTFSTEQLEKILDGSENVGKYFEALSEIEVIEDLDVVDGWKNFFGYGKTAEGLLKLILKYLEFKEISGEFDPISRKEGLEEIKTTKNKNLLLMNISDSFIPKNKQNTFLFTEQQKKNLGIKGIDEIRLEEKYNLFRAVMTSESTTILAIKNMGSDSSLSPFVEELLGQFKVKSKHLKQPLENYLELIKPNSKMKNIEDGKGMFEGRKPSEMKFEIEELKDPFGVTAYMCDELFNCKYKMYLRYLVKLTREELEVERDLTRREYGNLAHELFEAVLKKIELTRDYSLLEEGGIEIGIVMGVLEELVGSRRLKLPRLNERYYKEIIYKNLADSVGEFFRKISKELRGEKIKRLLIEELLKHDINNKTIDIKGRAKADLIIKTERKDYIVDFKTGNLNERQLDFYSILYAGEADLTEKYIFNVDKGNLEKSKKIKLVKDESGRNKIDPEGKERKLGVLEIELKELLNSGVFERNKTSKCDRCEYLDICKVGELDEIKG